MDADTEGAAQVLVSSIDYNEYVGRIGIGRIERGEVKQGQSVTVCNYNNLQLIQSCSTVPARTPNHWRHKLVVRGVKFKQKL